MRIKKPAVKPLPLLLSCPKCGAPHVDKDERQPDGTGEDWRVRPHVRHLCHRCATIWTPYDPKGREFKVPTVGIERFVPVFVVSPLAGDYVKNREYGKDAMLDCLLRGEAPIAPHLLYAVPGVLFDSIPEQRELGTQAGFALLRIVERVVVYTDLGLSDGMRSDIALARQYQRPIEMRSLEGWGDR